MVSGGLCVISLVEICVFILRLLVIGILLINQLLLMGMLLVVIFSLLVVL